MALSVICTLPEIFLFYLTVRGTHKFLRIGTAYLIPDPKVNPSVKQAALRVVSVIFDNFDAVELSYLFDGFDL